MKLREHVGDQRTKLSSVTLWMAVETALGKRHHHLDLRASHTLDISLKDNVTSNFVFK